MKLNRKTWQDLQAELTKGEENLDVCLGIDGVIAICQLELPPLAVCRATPLLLAACECQAAMDRFYENEINGVALGGVLQRHGWDESVRDDEFVRALRDRALKLAKGN